MTSGSRSSPAMTSAGSPGSNCCSEKIRIETKNSVGNNWTRRRARKISMVRVSRARAWSLEFQPDDAHQPVRHLLVAFQPGGMRDQDPAVIEVEDWLFVDRELRQLFVKGLALRLICDKASVVECLVCLGIGPDAVILRRVL